MNIKTSAAATAGVQAVLEACAARSKERTEEEKSFDAIVKSCVEKKAHRQRPLPAKVYRAKGKRLYVITTKAASARYGGTRTLTVCTDFKRAKQIVETNESDIWECSYSLAVIEAIVDGWLYSNLDEEYWYRWDIKKKRYIPIEKPAAYASMVGFGIG